MDDRQKIQERLKRKEQEILALEERLRTARTYVQALHDILKLLDGESSIVGAGGGSTGLRAGSSVHQARHFILKTGAPVHINALVEAIGNDTSRESRISLASSLAAYVRKGEIFTRPAPNTFGLIELGHKTVLGDDEGPPVGFGQIRPVPKQPQRPPAESPAPPAIGHESEGAIDDDLPF